MRSAAAAAVSLALFAAEARAATIFVPLGDLPGGPFSSAASDVSDDGRVVVGHSSSGNGSEAYRWTAETGMVGLGDVAGGAFSSTATGVSADGAIVVGRGNAAPIGTTSPDVAFRWTSASGLVTLGDLPGGTSSFASDVSADGWRVAGTGRRTSTPEAFLWEAGSGMIGLGDLPGGFFYSQGFAISADGTTVVGYAGSGNASGQEAAYWTQASGWHGLGFLPGGTSSAAHGVSDDGSVVVGTSRGEAFRWTAATGLVGLGDLDGGSFVSTALAVSGDGSVIVGDANTDLGREAFVWDAVHGMRSLRTVLTSEFGLDLTGWTLSSAQAISSNGLAIVGGGIDPLGRQQAWLAIVPEPGASVLLGIGLALLARRSRAHGCPA